MGGKKKNKKRSPQPKKARPPVRLSQCMIVKNEERNIERALSWARDIAFEQIVVDTGSTDRTVELAEKMGATVYHFEWIDDFAAAKNFAIDKAAGNWIALLDADEYMPPEDAKALMGLLERIERDSAIGGLYDALTCSWVQLDDNSDQIAVNMQARVFRNRPDIRYKGRIHENLQIRGKFAGAMELRIMHTGYAATEDAAGEKTERNIRLLKMALDKDPDNPELVIYLADSIKARKGSEADEEAEKLYLKALESSLPIDPQIKQLAYDFLIPYYLGDEGKCEAAVTLCSEAVEKYRDNIDYRYYLAVLQNQKGEHAAAKENLRFCEEALGSPGPVQTRILANSKVEIYNQYVAAAVGLRDIEGIIINSTLVLSEDKYRKGILASYISIMLKQGIPETEVIGFLQRLYDFRSAKDKLFIADAAEDCGHTQFAERVLSMITAEEREIMSRDA